MNKGVEPRLDFGSAILFALFSMGATAICGAIAGMLYDGLISGRGLELWLIPLVPILVFVGFLFLIPILGGAVLVSLPFFLIGNFFIPVRRFTCLIFAVSGVLVVYFAIRLTTPACDVEMLKYGQGCFAPNGLHVALFGGSAGGLFGYIRYRMLR